MLPILRTPLVRPLVRVTGRGLPFCVAAFCIAGTMGPAASGLLLQALCTVAVLTFGPALALAWTAGFLRDVNEAMRHAELGHRFLCPRCLRFGGFDYACRECGSEVNPFLRVTNDSGADACFHCSTPLGGGEGANREGLRACCRRCGWRGDPSLYHERRVRVLGVLSETDLDEFCACNGELPWTRGEGHARRDDGTRLTYVLNLGALLGAGAHLPTAHAAHAVETLWLDRAAAEPAGLRRALHGYLHAAPLPEGRRHSLGVFVRCPDPEAAVVNLLAARFGGVQPGIEPETVFRCAPPRPAEALPLAEVHVLATLLPCDFRTLWGAMDRRRRWLRGGGWGSENTELRVTCVLDMAPAGALRAALATLPSFGDVQALWLDLDGAEPLRLGRQLDRLIREGSLSDTERRRWVICVRQREPDRPLRVVIESRFRVVKYGVTPRQFVARGAAAAGGPAPARS